MVRSGEQDGIGLIRVTDVTRGVHSVRSRTEPYNRFCMVPVHDISAWESRYGRHKVSGPSSWPLRSVKAQQPRRTCNAREGGCGVRVLQVCHSENLECRKPKISNCSKLEHD